MGPQGVDAIVDAKRDGRFEAILLREVGRGEDRRVVRYALRLVDRDPEARTQAVQELASSVSHGE